ncbi:hypothetical protein IIV22A_128L [Invertebrate iridescent virus 22]|uniref:Uncharacterized protein n=1 Tax=Invertebrate iridescent virus 22 TaxID=345198 RepID=W8W1E4_9VIRU|nr:hypothetical protein IIV22A_128L [Invertebrate iridescent virus 22]CCV01972.1 hypothetical protein IIV22A_128L [Invertebrate iridescent virus 22]
MSNTSFRIYDPVAQLIATGGGGGLPSTGGTLTGDLTLQVPSKVVQCQPPTNSCDLANKAYVDAQVAAGTPDATTSVKGKIQLAGDLSGTASNPLVSPLAITNSKLANLSAVSQLKGSSSTSSAATDITLGPSLTISGTTLAVNPASVPSIPVLVSQGGTGATTLTGYLKGNGTSPITGVSSVPTTDLTGQFVGSVNGVAPTPTNGGNVSILLGNVTTGTLAARPVSPGTNGNIYVVSGDPTPLNNGRTYISDGTAWQEVTTNQAATDARYVLKAGDTISGNLNVPSGVKVLLSDLPTGGTDAANKNYVDAQISSGSTPDATTSVKGKVQLAGDLSGTASAPVVAPLSITNSKLANLSAVSQLKGSSSTSSTATDISLGSGLSMSGTTLGVDTSSLSSTFLPLAGGTMSGAITQPLAPVVPSDVANKAYVDAQVAAVVVPDATSSVKGIVQLAGDLSGTASAPIVAPLSITNSKLANLSAVSQLKGSSSTASTATDISLGSDLSMSGTTLNVNTSSLSSTFLPLTGGTMSGAITQPLAPVVPSDVANKAYVDAQVAAVVVPDATSSVKGIVQLAGDLSGTASAPVISPLSITNSKLANLSAVSQLKGSSSTSSTATDISVGAGLVVSGSTLAMDTSTMSKAGNAQFGVVEFDPSGDLVQTSSNSGIGVVKPLAITNAKLANMSAVSQLKGSSSTSSTVTDITIGPSMSIIATQLNSNISFFSGINPNITAPTDRPNTTNIAYIGNNGSLWLWDGTLYISSAQLGSQNYISLSANVPIIETSGTNTDITALDIALNPGQGMRVKYIMRCNTNNGSYTINFGFPNYNASTIRFSGIGYSANTGTNSVNGIFWATDLTDSMGVRIQDANPDWTTAGTRCYILDAEVVNIGTSSINWRISAVPSDSGVHNRSVGLGSSAVYSYF